MRSCHYPYIEKEQPNIPWFEVLSDNYLCDGGPSLYHLHKIREQYPITLHGVGMSLGSCSPLNKNYLSKLKTLIDSVKPQLISDHLCWTSNNDQHFHELLPLPYTEEAVKHVANRIIEVQDFLENQIMIENVSSYLTFKHSTLSEWEFVQEVANQADCLILLDINNVHVSATNNCFDPLEYLCRLQTDRVAQFHLAGFEEHTAYLLDTHSDFVNEEVLNLFKFALTRFGKIPTLLEWDKQIPTFEKLQHEVAKIQGLMDEQVAAA